MNCKECNKDLGSADYCKCTRCNNYICTHCAEKQSFVCEECGGDIAYLP